MLGRLFPPGRTPHGWRRALLHSPVLLYRLRLGRWFGHRFLIITHRGRMTGAIHRTPVEVVRYDPANDEAVVAAGWGRTSGWYQNLQASTALEIWIANRRFRPQQRFLAPDEALEVLLDYERRHPGAARELGTWMLGRSDDNSREAAEALSERVPLVAFRPAHDP
jgi:deazaflavin-dependent oxidoreductase (nitroreductase family)